MNSLLKTLPLILLVASSCGICKPRVEIVYRDSVRVEYRDSLIVRDSLIYVPLPDENSAALTALGQRSELETTLAESSAWVDSLGLHHELQNKHKEWGVHIPVSTHIITDFAHSDKTQTLTRAVKVPAELTWWQKARLGAFWYILALCIVGFRREIIALVKNILKFV